VYGAWAEHGRADPRAVRGEHLGQPDDPVLRGGVGAEARPGDQAGHRGGVHDVPALAVGLEYGQERVHAVDDAPQVDAEHPAPVVDCQVGDRGERPDARVVADHVHGTERLDGGAGQIGDALRVAHVDGNAGGADLRGCRLHGVPLDVGDDHLGALGGEPGGDALADPRSAACHHGDLPVQVGQAAHRSARPRVPVPVVMRMSAMAAPSRPARRLVLIPRLADHPPVRNAPVNTESGRSGTP
jgi:hypothetical protein